LRAKRLLLIFGGAGRGRAGEGAAGGGAEGERQIIFSFSIHYGFSGSLALFVKFIVLFRGCLMPMSVH
jgi:hypothetical protein